MVSTVEWKDGAVRLLDQSRLPRGTAFLAKPFEPETLGAAVDGLLAMAAR